MTSLDRATEIRDTALKAVADRITELGPEFHPAAIPIVAANVAMASMADQLLDDLTVQVALVVGHVRSLCAGEQPRSARNQAYLDVARDPDELDGSGEVIRR